MKAMLGLGILGAMPWIGYSLDETRAVAFHFMAVGQLLLTCPSRHTWMHPLPNPYLHAAVAAGIGLQVAAATVPAASQLLGHATISVELWGVVAGAALLAWAMAQACSRFVWRASRRKGWAS